MDSKNPEQELAWRIAVLVERLEDNDDDGEALRELDELIRSHEDVARIYLDTVRIATELPYSDVIEGGRYQSAEVEKKVSFPARLARIGAWPVAAVLAIGIVVFSTRQSDEEATEPVESVAAKSSPESMASSAPRKMPGAGSATVAHPAKTGRVKGGIVEPKGSIPESVTFNAHVRSILSENCFFCHGPDANTREGDLRLDSFVDATRDRDGYQVIAPGKVEESELILRLLEESE